jgi:hypothetical protein
MKFLREEEFIDQRSKKLVEITIENEEEPRHGIGVVLLLCLYAYMPNQRDTQVLDVKGNRAMNRCIDVLEGQPSESGHWEFESEDWKVLKQVVGWTSILVQSRNAPQIEDMLEKAVDQHPNSATKSQRRNGKATVDEQAVEAGTTGD